MYYWNDSLEVLIVGADNSLKMMCPNCGEVLTAGKFLICVRAIQSGDEIRSYLGGESVSCCGMTVEVFKTFYSEKEAEQMRLQAINYMNSKRSTDGLKLLAIVTEEELEEEEYDDSEDSGYFKLN